MFRLIFLLIIPIFAHDNIWIFNSSQNNYRPFGFNEPKISLGSNFGQIISMCACCFSSTPSPKNSTQKCPICPPSPSCQLCQPCLPPLSSSIPFYENKWIYLGIGIAVGLLLGIGLFFGFTICLKKRKKKAMEVEMPANYEFFHSRPPPPNIPPPLIIDCRQLDYSNENYDVPLPKTPPSIGLQPEGNNSNNNGNEGNGRKNGENSSKMNNAASDEDHIYDSPYSTSTF